MTFIAQKVCVNKNTKATQLLALRWWVPEVNNCNKIDNIAVFITQDHNYTVKVCKLIIHNFL